VLGPLSDLALAYRPALLFHLGDPSPNLDNEWWRPLEITRFLDEQWPDTTYLHQLCAGGVCSLPTQGAFEANDTTDAYLNINDDYSSPYDSCHSQTSLGGEVFDCNSGPRSALYFEPGQDSAAYRYLDYWWFFRGNHPGGTAGELDDHEGDWEGVTVVLDGINPASLSVAFAYYAAHQTGVWYGANALPFANSHAVDYVARGTHASYPFSCTDSCTPPPDTGWNFESPHDGGVPWGNNDDGACASACVQRYPDDPQRFSGSWWAQWHGRWGDSPGYVGGLGTSPQSPKYQSRCSCATVGYDSTCSRTPPPRGRQMQGSRSHRAPSPRVCANWFGSGVAVLACDPVVLRQAIRTHRMRQRGSLHLRVKGRRSGDSPGLAQVIGEPLRVGETIDIRGRATTRTILMVGVRTGQSLYRCELAMPKMPASRRLELRIGTRNGRPTVLSGGFDQHALVTRLR
jgi:Vacuolar protein sorting-associated protein 62